MCREARALVGLKHEVGPTVGLCQREIRRQNSTGIVDVLELRVRYGLAHSQGVARDAGRTIHLAFPGCRIQIALRDPGRMLVTEIVRVSQRNCCWIYRASHRQPAAGLDVVLRRSNRRCCVASYARLGAETSKEIIGCSVFLNDYNDVLEVYGKSRLGLSIDNARAQRAQQEKTLRKEFHRSSSA